MLPSVNYLSKFPGNGTPPQVYQQGPYGDRHPFPELSSTHPLPICPTGFYIQRYSFSRANGVLIHLCLSESLVKEPSHECGEDIRHRPWRPTLMEGLHTMGCGLIPQGVSFTTLLSLPKCHATFSIVSSTLVWIDQSQDVVVTLNRVPLPHMLQPHT